MIFVLTVGHPRFDTRIWVKEIASLLAAGYRIRYLVADGAGNEIAAGVEISDFGPIPERSGVRRRLLKMLEVVRRGGMQKDDIVHFHDAIFLPFAFLLWLRGCKLIYDVHEDYPRQVLNSRFPRFVKLAWSLGISVLEWMAGKLFHGIVAATPTIAAHFPSTNTVTVQNYPLPDELVLSDSVPYALRPNCVAYIGALSKIRGAYEMLQALDSANKRLDVRLSFGGQINPASLRESIANTSGSEYVDNLGTLSRDRVASVLADARAGLVVFHEAPNHLDAQPNKLFEYMSAGLPVIASDFPLWRQIVSSASCGLLVNPLDSEAISNAICWLLEHPDDAARMGRCGREAVERVYNWKPEEAKLLSFYKDRCSVGCV